MRNEQAERTIQTPTRVREAYPNLSGAHDGGALETELDGRIEEMKSAIAIVVLFLLASCQRNPPPQPIKEYQMNGEVVSLDSAGSTVTVKHGKIDGWMEAMTMEYPVKDQRAFAGLRVGEKIQAKIAVQGMNYWIESVSEDPSK